MDDLISRKAVFELLDDIDSIYLEDYDDTFKSYTDLVNALFDEDRLPSAQPKKRTEERTETHACDCISRQSAINSIEKHLRLGDELYPLTDTDKVLNHAFAIAASCVYNLPSAQSERQKGEWIDYTEDGYVECPFCHSATNCDGNKDELHFCFSCGADMRGEQDGNT